MEIPFIVEYPGLTPEQIRSEECRAVWKELQEYLTIQKVEELCVHESGHLYFARKAGVKAFPQGPRIYFQNDTYKYVAASTSIPDWEKKHSLVYSEKLLKDIGETTAAGGMFLERFLVLPEAHWGDADDAERFTKYCGYAHRYDSDIPIMVFTRWKCARNEVRKFLKNATDAQHEEINAAKNEVRERFVQDSFQQLL